MNIAILDDQLDTVRTLACDGQLAAHQVTIWRDHSKSTGVLAERLKDAGAIVLLRERTPIRAELLARRQSAGAGGTIGDMMLALKTGWRIAAAVVALAAGFAAAAQPAADYPARPVRMLVTFTAGGTPDAIARIVAGQVERQLGQSIVIDNRAGANGIIGTDIVAKSTPDGYTLLHVTGSFVINPRIYRTLPYDIFRDFAPITNLCLGTGYLLLVHPSVPAQSVKELIALAKVKPLSYGTPGVGNTLHLAMELFNVKAGTSLQHVPYKGVAPALNALLAGETQTMFIPPTIAVQHIRTGKARALGFTGTRRWSFMPEVPTIMESGVPDFQITGAWHGWLAPAKTPAAVIARIQAEAHQALQTPRVKEFILAGGYEPDGSTPESFQRFLKSEAERYADAVRAAGIKPE